MDDIIKIAKSLEDSGLSIDGDTEKIKSEINKVDSYLCTILASLIAHVVYSLIEPVAF